MRNIRVEVDGIKFASKREAKRYQELKLMLNAGLIHDLRLQRRYRLEVWGHEICTYVPDFCYVLHGELPNDDIEIVEDVKGRRAGAAYEMFKLKARLMKACFGIEVVEV